jgi:hypothetical protein
VGVCTTKQFWLLAYTDIFPVWEIINSCCFHHPVPGKGGRKVIKSNLKETAWECMDWIDLAQDSNRWQTWECMDWIYLAQDCNNGQTVVNAIMNFWFR